MRNYSYLSQVRGREHYRNSRCEIPFLFLIQKRGKMLEMWIIIDVDIRSVRKNVLRIIIIADTYWIKYTQAVVIKKN